MRCTFGPLFVFWNDNFPSVCSFGTTIRSATRQTQQCRMRRSGTTRSVATSSPRGVRSCVLPRPYTKNGDGAVFACALAITSCRPCAYSIHNIQRPYHYDITRVRYVVISLPPFSGERTTTTSQTGALRSSPRRTNRKKKSHVRHARYVPHISAPS